MLTKQQSGVSLSGCASFGRLVACVLHQQVHQQSHASPSAELGVVTRYKSAKADPKQLPNADPTVGENA